MASKSNVLIDLVRLSFQNSSTENVKVDEWEPLMDQASIQGVLGFAFDGIQKLSKSELPDKDKLLEWLGQYLYMEKQYNQYEETLAKLCHIFDRNGMDTLILKGYGLSKLYPINSHRPCGDIDIYLIPRSGAWNAYKVGNDLIESKGVVVDYTNHKHSTFIFNGQIVENHVNFFHVQVSCTEAKAEKVMQELLDEGGLVEYKTSNFTCFFPSPQMNYFYLMRHMASHFRTRTSVTLRHLLDWGVFLNSYGEKIDLDRGQKLFREFGLVRLNDIFTSLAADITGYDLSSYIIAPVNQYEKKRIMEDILNQGQDFVPSGKLAMLWYKTVAFFKLFWKYKYFNDNWEKAYFGLLSNIKGEG